MANPYLTNCQTCGRPTSRKYARAHGWQCKTCAEPDRKPTSQIAYNDKQIADRIDGYNRDDMGLDYGEA